MVRDSMEKDYRGSKEDPHRFYGTNITIRRSSTMMELKRLITTLRLKDPILVLSTRSKEEIRVNKEKVCHDTEAMPSTIQYIGLPDFPPRVS